MHGNWIAWYAQARHYWKYLGVLAIMCSLCLVLTTFLSFYHWSIPYLLPFLVKNLYFYISGERVNHLLENVCGYSHNSNVPF